MLAGIPSFFTQKLDKVNFGVPAQNVEEMCRGKKIKIVVDKPIAGAYYLIVKQSRAERRPP